MTPNDPQTSLIIEQGPEEKEKFEKEAKLKKEAKAKEDKKKEEALKPKPKYYYDVKVECMLPATLTYRVLAEDPQQAAGLIKGMSPTGVKHKLIGRKELKMAVYDSGSSMIRWMKNLLGT